MLLALYKGTRAYHTEPCTVPKVASVKYLCSGLAAKARATQSSVHHSTVSEPNSSHHVATNPFVALSLESDLSLQQPPGVALLNKPMACMYSLGGRISFSLAS